MEPGLERDKRGTCHTTPRNREQQRLTPLTHNSIQEGMTIENGYSSITSKRSKLSINILAKEIQNTNKQPASPVSVVKLPMVQG